MRHPLHLRRLGDAQTGCVLKQSTDRNFALETGEQRA
jgi:hypothetical protein